VSEPVARKRFMTKMNCTGPGNRYLERIAPPGRGDKCRRGFDSLGSICKMRSSRLIAARAERQSYGS